MRKLWLSRITSLLRKLQLLRSSSRGEVHSQVVDSKNWKRICIMRISRAFESSLRELRSIKRRSTLMPTIKALFKWTSSMLTTSLSVLRVLRANPHLWTTLNLRLSTRRIVIWSEAHLTKRRFTTLWVRIVKTLWSKWKSMMRMYLTQLWLIIHQRVALILHRKV